MLTQCPHCGTVFRAAPAQLKAAGGRVRCGQCETVFDALANTEEDPEAESSNTQTQEGETLAEVIREEDLLQLPDSDPLADTAEHELLAIEIESMPSIDITMEGKRIVIDGEDLPVDENLTEGDGEIVVEEVDLEPQGAVAPGPDSEGDFYLPSGTRVAFSEGLASEPVLPGALQARPRRRKGWMWGIGSTLLLLAIVAQLVHFNRDALVRNPLIGNAIAQAYEQLGLDLSPQWDLQAYEVHQWGATADPQASGTLRVRASLFNKADHAQPYPLLRLTLQDRFGGQVGARDVRPEEYLRGPPQGLLGAGERVDAQIAIVDPGKEAVGFEIDVCLQHKGAGIVCANDRR